MSAPETPAGESIPGHLCCQSKCCCAQGHPASCWDRLLCCAARAVFVCMVWGLCPRAFSSLSPLYGILPVSPLPPFLHTLVVTAFPACHCPCLCINTCPALPSLPKVLRPECH
uniref:Uncharacterized protein n=1 Tax=Marmota marmota marmota TaxID=9994 RepID=A0A8C5ZG04_MARMA